MIKTPKGSNWLMLTRFPKLKEKATHWDLEKHWGTKKHLGKERPREINWLMEKETRRETVMLKDLKKRKG